MHVRVLGCRGSTPATGAEFARYGGDTSSVAIGRKGEPPCLVLDAGTGLRRLGEGLDGASFRGSILLSHLHWDHTHGLPFAPAVDRDDAEVDLYIPAQGRDPRGLLARALGPPHFPITPDGLRGTWRFHALEPGVREIEGFEVTAAEVTHKGGRTFGYRVADGGASMAYVPDYAEAFALSHPVDLVSGTGLLLHDAQHTAAEMGAKGFLGHSSVEHAMATASQGGVERLWLFHHDPTRTDDEIDAVLSSLGESDVDVSAAAAGRCADL